MKYLEKAIQNNNKKELFNFFQKTTTLCFLYAIKKEVQAPNFDAILEL